MMSKTFSEWCNAKINNIINLYKDPNFEMLAYTQTFKPSKLQQSSFDVQHKYRSEDLVNILQDVVYFVALPESTVEGNVHYHGIIISIKKRKKRIWRNKALPQLKNLGYIKIKKVTDIMGWVSKYMLKDCLDFEYMEKNKSYEGNYIIHNYSTKTNFIDKVDDKDDEDHEIIFHCVRVKKIKKLKNYIENI